VISGTIDTVSARAVEVGIERPAIVFVGPAASSQPQMRWFDRRPLFGQRVLVTRPWRQSAVLAGRLTTLGAEVIAAPTVAIEPLPDCAAVDRALGGLAGYDWLVLTSVNGVNAAAKRLRHLGLDARSLASVRIAAIGPATAARLRELFIEPDLVPEEFVAEALAESMGATDLKGKRCLLLRSDIARRTLCDLLIEAGADCDDICAYRTTRPDSLPEQAIRDLEAGTIHWATFTSSSSFSNFADLLGTGAAAILPRLKLASIGPITSKTIRSAGYEPTVEAKVYTVEGLADAIAGHLAEARAE
jgi:uroporphyrinogen III methyltransferase/synthase